MSTVAKTAKPSAKKAAASGPSYEAMIKEAILAHPEEARLGLSRPTIKKFLHSKHPATSKVPEATFNNLISKALKKGAEKKTFLLPKGPSGKVKLSPAAKKPAAVKKPAVKKPAAKKPVKKTAAKKTATKTAAKKPAAKKTASSTATKAKKPAAKKTAAAKPKKATTTKKAAPKKAAPKKA